MKQIFAAIHTFQQECPPVEKLEDGYGYAYVDMTHLWAVIRPGMAKCGLTYSFYMDGNDISLILFHNESGEKIESRLTIPQGVGLSKMNAFQVIGSGITYFKRYMLIAALGIVTTDKDADACLPDTENTAYSSPVKTAPGHTVHNAHNGQPVTDEQVNNGNIFNKEG